MRLQSEKICIYVATGDYANPFLQRWQHIAREMGRITTVIYVSPCRGFDHVFGVRRAEEGLYIVDALHPVLALLPKATVLLSSVDQLLQERLALLERHQGVIAYDYIDAMDPMVDREEIGEARWKAHEMLLQNPEIRVITSARSLWKEACAQHPGSTILVTNGVDPDHYESTLSREGLSTRFRAILDKEKPILGYFGALARWLDYELLIHLASRRPDVEVVLIGVDYDGSLAEYQPSFPGNLHVHPRVEYSELPNYAVHFSVSIIPFVLNNVTMATSPLKLFEYMAIGRPIISTAIPEASRYSSPLVARDREEFVHLVDTALHLRNDPDCQATLAREAEANSWRRKALEVATFCDLLPPDHPGAPLSPRC